MNEIALPAGVVGERFKLRYLVWPVVAAMCAALATAHAQVIRLGEDYQGAWLPVDRLFDLTFAAGLLAVAFCVGRRGARWLRLSFASRAEEIAFSSLMGVGLIALAVLGLGLSRLLAPLPVALLLALLIALSWREGATLGEAIKQTIRSATASGGGLTLAMLFTALAAVLMMRALTPPHAYDEAIYHLPATQAFVDHGRVYPLIDNAAGNMPFLMQMIYAVCLMAKTDTAPRVFSLMVAFICALAIYGFCARFLSRRTGVVAAFAFFAAGMVIEVAVTCRVDVSLASMLFLATAAMMIHLKTCERGWLIASALMAGFALGIKHTAAVWIMLLGVMFLIESLLTRSAPLQVAIKRLLLYAALTLLVASPWFIKNQLWFHNPIYPFATGEVAALDGDRVRYFTPADEARLDAHFEHVRQALPALVEKREQELAEAVSHRAIQHPPHLWEYFTDADRYNSPEQYHDPNYLFLLAPLVLIVRRSRRVMWLAVLSIVYFALVTQVIWHSRYLLPVYPALSIVVAYALTNLSEWAVAKGRSRLLCVALKALPGVALVVMLGPLLFTSLMQLVELRGPQYLAGQLSRRGFMSSVFYYPMMDYMNRALPEDARVMMIGAQMSYGLRRDHIVDTSLDTVGWQRLLLRSDSMAGVAEDLKRQGVTHLLVGYSIFTWGAVRGGSASLMTAEILQKSRPDYYVQLRNGTTLDLFVSQYTEALYSDPARQVLYRLK